MPKEFLKNLEQISKLSNKEKDQIIEFLENIFPEITENNRKKIAEYLKEPRFSMEIRKIIDFSVSLYINFSNRNYSQDEFVDKVLEPSIKRSKSKIKMDENLREFIKKILSMDKTIGIFAKSIDLPTENVNYIINERITTDLRYIFYSDISSLPDYGTIQHNLRMTYFAEGKSNDIFFTYDIEELKKFKTIIERAIKKESTIRQLCEEKNIKILEKEGDLFDE